MCGIADIIVSGETPQEHDEAMLKMLKASRKNNISLNSEKLQFKQQKVDFYGHRLSGKKIQPSEDKLQTNKNIKTPTNPNELQHIRGMMTYLNGFSTKLAKITAPLRKLLKNGVNFRNASSSPVPDKERTGRCQNTVILLPRPRSEDNSTVGRQSTGFRSLVTTD